MSLFFRSNLLTRLCYFGIAFVALASVYDAWLVYFYREVIDEENRFCRWLISLEPTHVSVFLASKLAGTALVTAALVLLLKHWARVAIPTTVALVVFQTGLMFYLHTYDSNRYQLLARMEALEQEKILAASNAQHQQRRSPGKPNRRLAINESASDSGNDTKHNNSMWDSRQANSWAPHRGARRGWMRFPGERAPAHRPRKRPGSRMKSPAAS